jgi:hypothetical protein
LKYKKGDKLSIRKPKLTIEEQIEYLKTKGIKFELKNEAEAKLFLTENTYFFKLKTYCENYQKDAADRYVNLDFAYLVDLSTIDMHLRRFILRLTLDIEHMLKTKLLADFSRSDFDGYKEIALFLNTADGDKVKKFIKQQTDDARNNRNYSPNSPMLLEQDLDDLPLWRFVEVIQFGHLISFCNYFYQLLDEENQSNYNKDRSKFIKIDRICQSYKDIKHSLFNIKCLRNASAHNNCVLKLRENNASIKKTTYQFLLQNNLSTKMQINVFLKNHTISDFITSLLALNAICSSSPIKYHCFIELKELFEDRISRNCEYYKSNEFFVEIYKFMLKVINFFVQNIKIN